MATTTSGEEVGFDGKHLTVAARKGRSRQTIPVGAISSVKLSDHTWWTRPVGALAVCAYLDRRARRPDAGGGSESVGGGGPAVGVHEAD